MLPLAVALPEKLISGPTTVTAPAAAFSAAPPFNATEPPTPVKLKLLSLSKISASVSPRDDNNSPPTLRTAVPPTAMPEASRNQTWPLLFTAPLMIVPPPPRMRLTAMLVEPLWLKFSVSPGARLKPFQFKSVREPLKVMVEVSAPPVLDAAPEKTVADPDPL